jgi:hypothetical protein
MNASTKKPIQKGSRRFARSFMASRPGHTAGSDHHFDQAAIAALSCAQTIQRETFSWCYQRPQSIPALVARKKESLMKNIDSDV